MPLKLNFYSTASRQKHSWGRAFLTAALLLMTAYSHPAKACSHPVDLDGIPVFTSLAEALKNPDQVQRLHIKKKKLTAIPIEVFSLTNLIELNLSGNKIEIIPDDISKLINLKVLNISNNIVHTISDSLNALHQLELLDISRNYINTIPAGIQYLQKLTCLIIWKNEIGRLPDEIGALKDSLKFIDLRHNPYPPENIQVLEAILPDTTILKSRHCACNE
jgi:Leucine-rich repeat (LRR) protein